MATLIPFVVSFVAAPRYSVTFLGQPYALVITWNFASQRFYVNCYDITGALVFCVPLQESLGGWQINALTWNYYTGVATAVFAVGTGFLTRYRLGQIVKMTISQVAPTTYNGVFDCLITGDNSLTYPISADPGAVSSTGVASRDIDMAAAWFFGQSTLVYRNGQFEINP